MSIVKPAFQVKTKLEILGVAENILWDSRWYRDRMVIPACPECGGKI